MAVLWSPAGRDSSTLRDLRAAARTDTVPDVPARQNLVTPSDVGERVSFQYELPNGYVGEVVGVLEAWDEPANTYLVRNRQDELVRVPALGVRFGKVIRG
jgi:hypothetical protein